jgi:hypothetical protein
LLNDFDLFGDVFVAVDAETLFPAANPLKVTGIDRIAIGVEKLQVLAHALLIPATLGAALCARGRLLGGLQNHR